MANAAGPQRKKKRAIALAGGGPTLGFHIGALEALEEYGVKFDVWSLSCIGAWVGIYYNQLSEHELRGRGRAAATYEFFRENAFRDTDSYSGFPVNKAFAPNLGAYGAAWMAYFLDPQSYRYAFNMNDLPGAAAGWARFMTTPKMWFREGDVNAHVFNNILAVNPATRFLTSLIYMSEINGCSNIYYKESSFLDDIKTGNLDLIEGKDLDLDHMSGSQLRGLAASYDPARIRPGRQAIPEIYHNAWRLTNGPEVDGKLQLFNNKWLEYWNGTRKHRNYLPITRPSLCACSALPYVEQTVKIPNDEGHQYSEGALVDTVSFRSLVEDHPDLDEIWVCRIVDYRQVRLQKNLHDSLGNLCEQFAAEVGENDVELFKNHLRKSPGRIPRVVEIPLEVESRLDYRWDHENLEIGRAEGRKAVARLMEADRQGKLRSDMTSAPEWPASP